MAKKNEQLMIKQAAQMLKRGNENQAYAICIQILHCNKRNLNALAMLGQIETTRGRFKEAEEYLKQCSKYNPRNIEPLALLGELYATEGSRDKALKAYDRALRIKKDYYPALTGKANVLALKEKWHAAREILEPYITAGTEDSGMAAVYARVCQDPADYPRAIEVMLKHVDDPLEAGLRRMLHHDLATVYAKMGEHDLAFEHYAKSNRALQGTWDPDEDHQRVSHIMEVYTPDRIEQLPRPTIKSDLPLFIVGMARSGSTLVEQILASHPDVYGAGEIYILLDIINEFGLKIESTLPYPDCVCDLDQEDVDLLSRTYLEALRANDPTALRITDKYLDSFELIGLITVLFPEARILHTHRNPMDTCLSCYFQKFPLTFHGYTLDLELLGRRYAEYYRLMDYWRRTPGVEFLDIGYEDLIENQETRTRELLEYCGLPWDDRCLEFYRSKRTVITLSREQVNKPIYRTSIRRHQKYAKHLGPLERALREGGVPLDEPSMA